MSLSTVPMGVFLLLHDRGLIEPGATLCDFGSQELDAKVPENNRPFEVLFEQQGKPVPRDFYDAESGRMYGIAGDYWKALGWDYASFDIDGRFGSKVVDLNVDYVEPSDRGQYSLTMNIGTGEHVFDQHNFYRQAHDVTCAGGLMFHLCPFHAYQNHGLYSYSPAFFVSLARYNDYEVLGLWQCGKPRLDVYRSAFDKPVGQRVVLISVMRKLSDAEFRIPLQVNEPMVLSPEAEGRYGSFAHKKFTAENYPLPDVLPSNFYLDAANGTVHDGLPEGYGEAPLAEKRKEKKKAAEHAAAVATAASQTEPQAEPQKGLRGRLARFR